MEVSDMLDVLHYFLEEDLRVINKDETLSKSATRERIYEQFYDREYKYAYSQNTDYEDPEESYAGSPTQIDDYGVGISPEELRSIKAFNPKENPAKPYVPPTKFDETAQKPFGNLLDEPLM